MRDEPLGLGRRWQIDWNDLNYPASEVVTTTSRTSRYWNTQGWWGDQGAQPFCVAYAWLHYLADGPITTPEVDPVLVPFDFYKEAQRWDEWPGENYEGTSIRGAAKVLQRKGLIGEYRWALSLKDIEDCLLTTGPVVFGTNWYDSMFEPGRGGLTKVEGDVAGGHAYVACGINTKTHKVKFKNSWGREWGNKGFFTMTYDDVDRLLWEDGEVCLATELRSSSRSK